MKGKINFIKASLLILVLSFFLGCRTVPITGRRQLITFPDSQLLTLSLNQYHDLLRQSRVIRNTPQAAQVNRVGNRITRSVERFLSENGLQSELANLKWEFNLIDSKQANAFCMPGGKIVVYTGILPYTRTDDGLAVVLGHEIAHAIAKHANERLSNAMAISLGGAVVGSILNKKSENLARIFSTLYPIGTNIGYVLPHSRRQELEADEMGLVFMTMAKYNPYESIRFWQRMSGLKKGSSDFFSTHPSDQRRIDALQSEIEKLGKYTNEKKAFPVSKKIINNTRRSNTSKKWTF